MLYCLLSYIGYSECFTRSCLTVSEQRHHSFLEESGQQWLDLKLVDVVGSLFVAVGVVEHELVVLDVLRNPVHFYFWFVHLDARVKTTDCVYFALIYFFLKKRSFTHTNTNVHLIRADVIKSPSYEWPLLLDHLIVIEITDFACCLIGGLLFFLFSFKLFKLPASVFSLLLKLFYVINDVGGWLFC